MTFDLKKYEGLAQEVIKNLQDELEMRNYLELLKMAKEANLIDQDDYNEKVINCIKLYEK